MAMVRPASVQSSCCCVAPLAGMVLTLAATWGVQTRQVKACRTWGVLLVEAPSDVQASVIALAAQVKANPVWAVLAAVAVPLNGVQPTRVTAHPACILMHSFLENKRQRAKQWCYTIVLTELSDRTQLIQMPYLVDMAKCLLPR